MHKQTELDVLLYELFNIPNCYDQGYTWDLNKWASIRFIIR